MIAGDSHSRAGDSSCPNAINADRPVTVLASFGSGRITEEARLPARCTQLCFFQNFLYSPLRRLSPGNFLVSPDKQRTAGGDTR